ncbi:nicotinamide mononucleotide transporter [Sedimentibacter sp. zth1]|uniref:nicotinamide riboside transporter PnuC n=1 Tax=Sedimentibacter sp. zth1 TaxID=2816908 RepID=UPI001A90D872|nr:nicotinamide riboside transporter PnuC [Sedimentibacter sp. zth1]QSX06107.1 nicotinamide mononucleotide transporter [Sedimentibacter sp. zth1]
MKKIKQFLKFFTLYEKMWFLSIVFLSILFAFIFPEEETRGINGKIIMVLYLVDIFSNVACELLIAKQSKWNFIVSLLVEVTEIAICIILAYRFATLAVTLFFWIPIDIISFITWNRHKDTVNEELTVVRKLSTKQSILVVCGIVIWTVVVGYLLTKIEVEGIISDYPLIEQICCYLDACASAVGIANGVFILLRYREQWIAWYICSALETAINIMAGQWILLVLKAGYFTNTTYGYIKWTKYIAKKTVVKKLN